MSWCRLNENNKKYLIFNVNSYGDTGDANFWSQGGNLAIYIPLTMRVSKIFFFYLAGLSKMNN